MDDELRFWMEQRCDDLRRMATDKGLASKDAYRLQRERDEAVKVLRDLCEHHGDNDWPDDLHLADAIDKHLGKHLG